MLTRTTTVGPSASGGTFSNLLRMDEWAGGQIGFQTVVTGTATYSVVTSFDDPNDPVNPVPLASMTWDSVLSGVNNYTQGTTGDIKVIPRYIAIEIASGSGSVAMTVTQSLNVPF